MYTPLPKGGPPVKLMYSSFNYAIGGTPLWNPQHIGRQSTITSQRNTNGRFTAQWWDTFAWWGSLCLDLFALSYNKKRTRYCSRVAQGQNSRGYTLLIPWSENLMYACLVLRKIQQATVVDHPHHFQMSVTILVLHYSFTVHQSAFDPS